MRRLTAILAAAMVIAIGTVAPAGAQDDPPPDRGRGGRPVTIAVESQTPWVAPDGAFQVDLLIRGAPPSARVVPRLHARLPDRADFATTLLGVGFGPVFANLETVPTIGGGIAGPARATVRVPIRDGEPIDPNRLNVPDPGVYPLELQVVDGDGDERGEPLVTYLVRLPDGDTDARPLTTTLILPIRAAPGHRPDGSISIGDDQRAGIRALTDAVTSRPDLPLTLAPTPETIESLVVGGEPGAAVVEALRQDIDGSAGGTRQVLGGTYVDVPLAAWAGAGLVEELDRQRLRGSAVLERELARSDTRTWVADEDLTPAAVDRLQELGVDQLVVPEQALASSGSRDGDGDETSARPFVLRATGGPLRSMQVEEGLRGAFTRGDDPVLAAHRLLAEVAIVAFEEPSRLRGLVLAPPPDWEPSTAFLDPLLDGLTLGPPMLDPATVDEFFDRVTATPGPGGEGTTMTRALAGPPPADLGDYPDRLRDARRLLGSYQAMLGPTGGRFATFDDRLLASGAEALDPERRQEYLDAILDGVAGEFARVDTSAGQTITLTSREGEIPVTVRNRLDHEVTVTLQLSSSRRLEFPDGTEVVATLEPGTTVIPVDVETRTSGDSPFTITVRSPEPGGYVIATSRYTVRSTAVSGIGLVLSIGAAGFLVVWWFRHIRRSRRQHRDQDPAFDPA